MKWVFAVALGLIAAPAGAETVSGSAVVIDGDTLTVEGRRIRMFGIDAPELSQSCDRNGVSWECGAASAERLRGMIGGEPVTCTGHEVDIFLRLIAVCAIGGSDLNRQMVAEGWAVAFRRYSDDYLADETRARAYGRGIWSSSFTPPEDFRRPPGDGAPAPQSANRERAAPGGGPSASQGCRIKGNRNRRGEWIYHLPGMPYYDQTRAEEMFCTEAEARAAGYRRSRAQ